jgi:hypothetical protein
LERNKLVKAPQPLKGSKEKKLKKMSDQPKIKLVVATSMQPCPAEVNTIYCIKKVVEDEVRYDYYITDKTGKPIKIEPLVET